MVSYKCPEDKIDHPDKNNLAPDLFAKILNLMNLIYYKK